MGPRQGGGAALSGFPLPRQAKDITHQVVGIGHPLVSLVSGTAEQPQDSALGRRLHGARGSLQQRAGLLHRLLTGTLLDSHNVLAQQLHALPPSCYAPQSLDTLRLVMLPGATQLSEAPVHHADVGGAMPQPSSRCGTGLGCLSKPRQSMETALMQCCDGHADWYFRVPMW